MYTVTAGGAEIPVLGLGTAPMQGEDCRRAVETALDLGYRHVDTAQSYDNETVVGKAIDEASVPREEIFLVTKVSRENLSYQEVVDSVENSLDRLDTHIDLLLIHAPSHAAPVHETIGAMNELQDRGAVSHIGVSNFDVEQLEGAIDASDTPIVTNQVSYHPYQSRSELLAYCIDNDVVLTAYSPLAKGEVVGDETLREIGDRYDKTEAQVALRWLIQQRQVVAIPKASSRDHIAENSDVFDFELTDEEMAAIFDLDAGLADRLRSLLGL